MATLTNTKVKDTYQTLLKITAGSIGAGFSVVQDGAANDSGLSVSTTGVGVTKLTFTNMPVTGNTETLALFLNSSREVIVKELATSAFTNPSIVGSTGISVSGGFPTFSITNTAPDQTVTLTGAGGTTVSGTYPNFTISSSATGTGTTYDYAAVGAAGNISLALTGSDGSNDVVTMQAGSKITLTDNGSNTFTVNHGTIGTTKTTNTTALAYGGTFKAIDAVTYSDGHLTQYREQTYTLPTAAAPETLILRFVPGAINLNIGQDLLFEPTGTSTKTDSLHINPLELLPDTSGFEVVNDCIAKVSLGAYINNNGQSGQITFELTKNLSGVSTLLGSASFDMSNQAVSAIPTTFLSFFDFQAGATYIFTAYSTQHQMNIIPGSFIQIEILK